MIVSSDWTESQEVFIEGNIVNCWSQVYPNKDRFTTASSVIPSPSKSASSALRIVQLAFPLLYFLTNFNGHLIEICNQVEGGIFISFIFELVTQV